MAPSIAEITADAVREAAKRIAGAVNLTPCLHSRTLSQICGAEVYLKFENLQFTASFKERGALNKLLSLSPEERARGVIAMSAGNHAQALAYHAARLGVRAVIYMPRGSPNSKVQNTRVHGAEVVLEGNTLAESARAARARAAEEQLTFVHPYDDPLVIAGQGTVALEMLEAVPDLDLLVVPVGGGGLIAGMLVYCSSINKNIEVVGVESVAYPSMQQRLAGLPVEVGGDTVAEGIAVKDVGELPFALLKKHRVEVLAVAEETIERAVVAMVEIEKTVAEGAGAAGLAALLEHPARFAGRRVGVPLTGGNIDSRVLAAVLMRGLARDGRLLRLRAAMPDIAGSLARVTALIAEAGGNIVEVQHQRMFGTGSVRSTEVEFLVETRDRAHGEALVAALRSAGLKVDLPE
jgi:threonine dehydratase